MSDEQRIVLRNRASAVLRVFQVPAGQKSRKTRKAVRKMAAEWRGKSLGELHSRGYRVGLL